MEKNSISDFLNQIDTLHEQKNFPEKLRGILRHFFLSYLQNLSLHRISIAPYKHLLLDFIKLVQEQVQNPYSFQPYHQQIRTPYDYYKFGLDFLRPLIDMSNSSVTGEEHLLEIEKDLKKGNVILLANHQIEADPQAISILLEKSHPKFAMELIFVAGERVITDPLAIPFSMGRNLLCIYSKRYIDHPPELKHQKQLHNKRTMQLMSDLLSEGGKAIYVAPSGGRDRPNAEGIVEVAPFDPHSIEMLYLMAKKASKPTYFYPMALATYHLLPPPETIQRELGEKRLTKRGGIHLGFGSKIDMDSYPGCEHNDKHVRRKARAEYIWNLVKSLYSSLPGVNS